MTENITQEEKNARTHVDTLIASLKKPLVALSGGVDSALIAARVATCAPNGAAATLTGVIYAAEEIQRAREIATMVGICHYEVFVDVLSIPEIQTNPEDRCYHCRKTGMSKLITLAQEKGYDVVLDGENVDDAADYRPGSKASRELGLRAPLRECGFTKGMIRRWSRELGLPTAELPAAACLASRIPFGVHVTEEILRQIEHSEAFLKSLGFQQVRVRHHGDTARIEVETNTLSLLTTEPTRTEVLSALKSFGYKRVTLDLSGYSMGSFTPEKR